MILQSNLEIALKIAIREQRRAERGARYEKTFRLVDKLPDLEEYSSKIEYKKFEFSA